MAGETGGVSGLKIGWIQLEPRWRDFPPTRFLRMRVFDYRARAPGLLSNSSINRSLRSQIVVTHS